MIGILTWEIFGSVVFENIIAIDQSFDTKIMSFVVLFFSSVLRICPALCWVLIFIA